MGGLHMNALILISLIFLSQHIQEVNTRAFEPEVEDEDLVKLDQETFDDFISKHEFVLVSFCDGAAGKCKERQETHKKAVDIIRDHNSSVPMAVVDTSEEQTLAKKYHIQWWPTLKFFVNGSAIDYTGGHGESDIAQWVLKKSQSPVVELKTYEDCEKFKAAHQVALIFLGQTDTKQFNNYVHTARQYDDLAFGYSTNEDLLSKYELYHTGGRPQLILFKHFDEGRNDFRGGFLLDELRGFIFRYQYPTIFNFSQKAARRVFGDGHSCVVLFYEDDEEGRQAYEEFEEAAPELKGKAILAIAGLHDSYHQQIAQMIGVTAEDLPTVRIINPNPNAHRKYILDHDITKDNIIQFFNDFASGKLKPFFKSDEEPEEDENHPVKPLVGSTFHDFVYDDTKDVVVMFTASWCHFCHDMNELFNKVAADFKHITSQVVFARMDSHHNEVEGLKIVGYPNVKMFRMRNKEPIQFNGQQKNEAELVDWINTHKTDNEL